MRCVLVIACIAVSVLAVKGEGWGWSDCACGTCSPGCVPTKQRLYFGGRNICYCYCKCSSSPPAHGDAPPLVQQPPPTNHKPQPPPPSSSPQPPPDQKPPPNHHHPPQAKTPPSQQPKTPAISQQQCESRASMIDRGCDYFAKLIPTMHNGPMDVKFTLGQMCCESIAYARECYPDLYAGLDLQKSCY